MPSPKAFLRDVHDFKLDPKVAHTKAGADGRCHGKEAVKVKAEKAVAKPAKAETADAITKTSTEEPKKQHPSASDHSGRTKQKKAANANDSVDESNVPSDKQEATEEPAPAAVPELDVDNDV